MKSSERQFFISSVESSIIYSVYCILNSCVLRSNLDDDLVTDDAFPLLGRTADDDS